MSIDTLSPAISDDALDERIVGEQEDALVLPSFDDLNYEEVAELFAATHDEKVADLVREKRGLLLEYMLAEPVEAFRWEIEQLSRLYEGRTSYREEYDGQATRHIRQFCTQNHDRQKVDYLFTQTTFGDGAERIEVERVFTELMSEPTLYMIRLQHGKLSVVAEAYSRGRYHEVAITGECYDEVMSRFFEDTIRASALQFERTPEDIDQNNQQAREYLGRYRDAGVLF